MVGSALRKGLGGAGFAVDWVRDGHSAELAVANAVYDLTVLDLGLPRKDGMSVLSTLRNGGSRMPVLVVTARDAVQDRIKGLNDEPQMPEKKPALSAEQVTAITRWIDAGAVWPDEAAGEASAGVTHWAFRAPVRP